MVLGVSEITGAETDLRIGCACPRSLPWEEELRIRHQPNDSERSSAWIQSIAGHVGLSSLKKAYFLGAVARAENQRLVYLGLEQIGMNRVIPGMIP